MVYLQYMGIIRDDSESAQPQAKPACKKIEKGKTL